MPVRHNQSNLHTSIQPSNMDGLGLMNMEGKALSQREVQKSRERKGQCLSCGQKLYKKKVFKLEPITIEGKVLNGRCLVCDPVVSKPSSHGQNISASLHSTSSDTRKRRGHRTNALAQYSALSKSNSNEPNPIANLYKKEHRRTNTTPLEKTNTSVLSPVAANREHRRANTTDLEKIDTSGSSSVGRRTRRGNSPPPGLANTRHPRRGPVIKPGISASSLLSETSALSASTDASNNSKHDDSINSPANGVEETRKEMLPVKKWTPEYLKDGSGEQITHSTTNEEELQEEISPEKETKEEIKPRKFKFTDRQLVKIYSVSQMAKLQRELKETEEESSPSTSAKIEKETEDEVKPLKENFDDPEQSELSQMVKPQHNLAAHEKEPEEELLPPSIVKKDVTEKDILDGADGLGFEEIITAVKKIPHSAELYTAYCTTLTNITYSSTDYDKLVKTGIVDLVLTRMNEYIDDIQVQEVACVTLSIFSSKSLVLKDAITKAEGVTAVLFSLMAHQDIPNLIHKSMGAMNALCTDNDDNKLLIANMGGIDYIALAMQQQRDNPNVQRKACWLISNLALNADLNSLIASYGGIDLIIRAMWVHLEDSILQQGACLSIGTFAYDPNLKERIVQLDGISAILTVMQAHENPSVQGKACWALSEIARNSEEYKIRIVESGAIHIILKAMAKFPDSLEVQEKGCGVLETLACDVTLSSMTSFELMDALNKVKKNFPTECKAVAEKLIRMIE